MIRTITLGVDETKTSNVVVHSKFGNVQNEIKSLKEDVEKVMKQLK